MINNKTVSAILLIAGNSSRLGKNQNKNLVEINNIPVFLYSLNVLINNKYIDNISLVVKKEELELIEQIVQDKNVSLVLGGSSRQQSVYNALVLSDSDIVVIHDGARPMIKDIYIEDCLEALNTYKGISIAVKSKDTIKITDDSDVVINTTDRKNTWIIQTPQCFDRKTLLDAHIKYKDSPDITDDCMLLEKCGYPVKLIPGGYTNIKITTEEDFQIVEQMLNKSL